MNGQAHDHIVRSHDEEQRRLQGELLRMGGMAASQLAAALDAVERRDDRAAWRVVENDVAIDELEQDAGRDAMKLGLRGPLARDLRQVLAALRIASDIERIGDHAANIARRSIALHASPALPEVQDLRGLGALALQQLRDVLAAYRDGDAASALRVREADAALDVRYIALFRALLARMEANARAVAPCTHLLFMARNLERIGDHATNIAENVWFLARGDAELPPRAKGDDGSGTPR